MSQSPDQASGDQDKAKDKDNDKDNDKDKGNKDENKEENREEKKPPLKQIEEAKKEEINEDPINIVIALDENSAVPGSARSMEDDAPAESSGGRILRISIRPSQSVAELKVALLASENIPVYVQRILYMKQELRDTMSLSSAGVIEGSILRLSRRLIFSRHISSELRSKRIQGSGGRDEEAELYQKRIYETMLTWLEDNGATFRGKVERAGERNSFDLGGLVVSKDYKAGERIVSIPLKCLMSTDVALKSEIGQKIGMLQGDQVLIASYLLQEKRDPESIFKQYIDLLRLPSELDKFPVFYSPELKTYLKGSFTVEVIEQRLKDYKKQYDIFCKQVPFFRTFSFEEYIWARIMVVSRNFGVQIGGRSVEVMVPLADTIQHGQKNCNWEYMDDAGAFVISAAKDIPKGGTVSVSFGHKCNSRFFINYGFVVLDNGAHNVARVEVTLPKSDPLWNLKKKVLGEQDFGVTAVKPTRKEKPQDSGVMTFSVGRRTADAKTEDCLDFCRLVACKDEKEVISALSNPGRRKMTMIVNRENEIEAHRIFLDSVKASIAGFETTLEEDMKFLTDCGCFPENKDAKEVKKPAKKWLGWYDEDEEVRLVSNARALPIGERGKVMGSYLFAERTSLDNVAQLPSAIVTLIMSYLDETIDVQIRNAVAVRAGEKEVLHYFVKYAELALGVLTSNKAPDFEAVKEFPGLSVLWGALQQDDAISTLIAVAGCTKEQAQQAYRRFGGRVEEAILHLTSGDMSSLSAEPEPEPELESDEPELEG